MPTHLPLGGHRKNSGRASFALSSAMLTSVLLFAALVQITEQLHFSTPAYAQIDTTETPTVTR